MTGSTTWLAAVSAYVAVTVLSGVIDDRPGPVLSRLYLIWDHWDTGHYMRISRVGYTPDRLDTHAFFPMFPMVLHVADAILPGPTLVASLVLANVFCIAALVVLHRFASRGTRTAIADRTVLFLMAFPTGLFLCAGYNGSMYLLLAVSALYCLRSGRFWAAGAIGAVASGTRLTGVLLVVPFVIEYARQHGWRPGSWAPNSLLRMPRLRRGTVRPDLAAVSLIPVGVAGFAVFCWVSFGDPLSFVHAGQGWDKHLRPPWDGFGRAIARLQGHSILEPIVLHNLLDVVSALAAIVLLVLCVVGPWPLRRDQLFMIALAGISLLTVLVSTSGGSFPMGGTPRYALELIPIFLLLGRLGARRVFERLYLMPAITVQAVLLLAFMRNVWVA